MQKLIMLLLLSLSSSAFAGPMVISASTMGELGIFSLIGLSGVMAALAVRFIKHKKQSDD